MDVARFVRIIRGVLRSLAVLINNLYCIPTYVVWCIILHPVYFWRPDLYWMIEGQFFQWLLTMVAYWSYSAGYYIVESGDIIEKIINDETLVLVNHQSTSDVPLLMYAFCARNSLLQRLNWIMDAVFQYTNFGVVSTLHGDFFINAGKDRREQTLKDLESYLQTKYAPRQRKWLVLFPEGGFLRKRKEASKRFAAKNGLPNLENVTVPRLGALQTIINTLCYTAQEGDNKMSKLERLYATGDASRNKLKYIIDMTIAYPNGVPLDLGTVITGYVKPCTIRMHYKIYALEDVPYENPNDLQEWLYNLYIEKNSMLEHYYKTGVLSPDYRKLDANGCHETNENDGYGPNKNIATSGQDMVDEARAIPKLSDDGVFKHKHHITLKGEGELKRESELLVEENEPIREKEDCTCEPLTDEEFYKAKPKTLHLDLLRICVLHFMFITSTMLHCCAARIIYLYACSKFT